MSREKVSTLAVQTGKQSPPGCDRLDRVIAAGQAQFGPLDLNRVVECVPGEIGPLAERVEPQQRVADSVPGRGLDRQAAGHREGQCDDPGLASRDDRPHALVEHRLVVLVGMRVSRVPASVLLFREQVLSPRKSRHPALVGARRVPSAVIAVQMGAEHEVHILGRGPRRPEPVQPRKVQVVEEAHLPPPAVSVARVDEDGQAVGLDKPAVVGELERRVTGGMMSGGRARGVTVHADAHTGTVDSRPGSRGQQRESNGMCCSSIRSICADPTVTGIRLPSFRSLPSSLHRFPLGQERGPCPRLGPGRSRSMGLRGHTIA